MKNQISTADTVNGVRPAQQARSKKRRDDLLDAGLGLLRQKSLDELTIQEIAKSCDSSVGAFYSRFTNKEGFFKALQSREVEKTRVRFRGGLSGEVMRPLTPRQRVQQFVETVVREVRNMQGILYASLKHESVQPDSWTPHHSSSVILAELAVQWLCKESEQPVSEEKVKIAAQLIFGVLVDAMLHRPGPIQLEDPELTVELGIMMSRYLLIPDD